jgi:hypothetical protein
VPNRAVGQAAADGYRRLADESSSTANSLLSRLQNRDGTPSAVADDTEPKTAAEV